MLRIYGDDQQFLLRYQSNLVLVHQGKIVTPSFPTSNTKKDKRQKEKGRTFHDVLEQEKQKSNKEK